MTDILFYHLTEKRMSDILPGLLQKCLDKQWNVVVQTSSQQQVDAMDTLLWSWSDDAFLPHGCVRDGSESVQPVWLTSQTDNPNNAAVRFIVDEADPPDLSGYERGIYIFDGHSESELKNARLRWKAEKEAGNSVTYWQQNSRGGWDKKSMNKEVTDR